MYTKEIGQVLHRLRKGKRLTVKYLTQDLITPQHYYHVEKGTSEISVSFLITILDRMNVSFREFAVLVQPDIELKRIQYENNHPILERHNTFSQHHFSKGYSLNDDKLTNVRDFLVNKEEYFHYEMALFNDYLPCLPLNFVSVMAPTFLKKLTNTTIPKEDQINYFKLALNLATYFTEHHALKTAISIVDELETKENLLPDLSIVTFLHFKFIKAVLQDSLEQANRTIDQLILWGFDQTAKQFRSFVRKLGLS